MALHAITQRAQGPALCVGEKCRVLCVGMKRVLLTYMCERASAFWQINEHFERLMMWNYVYTTQPDFPLSRRLACHRRESKGVSKNNGCCIIVFQRARIVWQWESCKQHHWTYSHFKVSVWEAKRLIWNIFSHNLTLKMMVCCLTGGWHEGKPTLSLRESHIAGKQLWTFTSVVDNTQINTGNVTLNNTR